MKIPRIVRATFWLSIMLAVCFWVRAESADTRTAVQPQKTRAVAPPIRIVDERGQPAVSGIPSATSQIVDVSVGGGNGFQFVPDTVNISVGDTVRWTWVASFHSVTSGPPCQADSQYCSPDDMNCSPGVLSNAGTVYTHTFTTPGTYLYHCLLHCLSGMTGVINVSGGCSPSGWSAGQDLPSVNVRGVGVYFQANGKFYEIGGRSGDISGTDFTHPFEYDPSSNTWITKSALYPDNQVNNMACAVLADAGTPYIYCAGGSAAGGTSSTDRMFRYNPVTDALTTIAAPWPGASGNTVIPGGFTVFNNKLYILGGLNVSVLGAVNTIWEFTPGSNTWVQKTAMLPVGRAYIPTTTIGSFIYTGGGSDVQNSTLVDTTDSFKYNPVADSITTITSIPRATGETRALAFNGQMLVMGGGRVAPNPSNEVDVYSPASNSWTANAPVPAFGTARRNFPTDTDGISRIWLSGGYAPTAPTASTERFCNAGGATPTPTPTATATSTATATATSTATATATRTPTATPTATATAQATATPTATPTSTATASATATATATSTHTPTATPTGTPSSSPRPTPTPRARPTPAPRP